MVGGVGEGRCYGGTFSIRLVNGGTLTKGEEGEGFMWWGEFAREDGVWGIVTSEGVGEKVHLVGTVDAGIDKIFGGEYVG